MKVKGDIEGRIKEINISLEMLQKRALQENADFRKITDFSVKLKDERETLYWVIDFNK